MYMNKNLSINVKQSLGFRLFTAFVCVLITVLSVYTIFSVIRERKEVKADLIREGEMLTSLLAYYSKAGVFAENINLLKTAAESIKIQKDISRVSIYNAELKALYVFNKMPSEKQDNEDVYLKKMISDDLTSAKSIKVIETRNAFDFLKPVVLESFPKTEELLFFDRKDLVKKETVIGYVRIVLDKSSYHAEILSILLNNIALAFIFILSGIVIIYLAVKKFTKPLATLTEHMRLFGTGEYVEKAPVDSMDEIGKLAETFNAMIENLRKRENELRQAQKMEALGRFARGIAHDFNNILATIQGIVYILKKKLKGHSSVIQYPEQIQNSLAKMQNLIKGLLRFSKTQTIYFQPLDINKIIKRLTPLLKDLAGDTVNIETSLSEEPFITMADELQIEQVFINLCTNARDAMPEGGLFTIKTESFNIDNEYALKHPLMKPGRYILISATDTGSGMNEKIKEKIFEPFFTTKEDSKGMGLGLSIVYGIIEQHKGHIDIDTELGKGTVFKIFLPLMKKNR
jgi:signal transduction histidine kinase